MSTDGKKKTLPVPPQRKNSSSLRIVLMARRQQEGADQGEGAEGRERDGDNKSSATPPPVPPKILWDVSLEERKELAKEIGALETGGHPKAGEMKALLTKIGLHAQAKPKDALSQVADLRKTVELAKAWHAKLPERTKVDDDIKQLEQKQHPLAATFRDTYNKVETNALTDTKVASSGLLALGKDTAGALEFENTAQRRATAKAKLEELERKEFVVQGYVDQLSRMVTLAGTKPGAAMTQLVACEKYITKCESEQSPKSKEYSRRIGRNSYEYNRIKAKHKDGGYDGAPAIKSLYDDLDKKRDTAGAAAAQLDYDLALSDVGDAETLVETIKKHEFDQALVEAKQVLKDNPKKKDARAKFTELAKTNPRLLNELCGSKEGQDMIDELVDDLGSKVTAPADKAFLKEAVKGRFALDLLDGDLTTKALPQIYKLFKQVPGAHTHGNPSLTHVRRNKGSKEVSYYQEKESKVCLNLKKSSSTSTSFDFDDDTAKKGKVSGKTINYFNHTTLHEIGHAVDQDEGFMTRNGGHADYGGWQEHKVAEVAHRVAHDGKFGFVQKWKDVPEKVLLDYLKLALQGKSANVKAAKGAKNDDLETDAGMVAALAQLPTVDKKKPDKDMEDKALLEKRREVYKLYLKGLVKKMVAKSKSKDRAFMDLLSQAITKLFDDENHDTKRAIRKTLEENGVQGAPDNVNWDEIAKDDAVKWCQDVRLKGDSDGLWEKGAKAKGYALSDGRIYHEAYSTTWYSYESAARTKGISSYQFRSPVEWYAECYAAYFLGKLAKDHVMTKYLDKLKPG
jgi:hypothetical protein